MAKKTKNERARVTTQTRWLAALGLVFIVGSFAMLLRESFSTSRPVAAIVIRVNEVLPSSGGFLVNLKVGNTGDGTAAALAVEGVLTRNGTDVETSLVTVDYVAARSERDATLFFSNDPRDGKLIVRPKGYIEP